MRSFSARPLTRAQRAPETPVPHPRNSAAAVVHGCVLAAGLALAGCEYTYDDGRTWSGATDIGETVAPAPAFTRHPAQRTPLGEADLDAWMASALPDTGHLVVHAAAGFMAGGDVRAETTAVLGTGTYALALACRSQRRVTFTVRSDTFTLVDLGLRCGINRENVVYLSTETALSIKIEASADANYAYRIRQL